MLYALPSLSANWSRSYVESCPLTGVTVIEGIITMIIGDYVKVKDGPRKGWVGEVIEILPYGYASKFVVRFIRGILVKYPEWDVEKVVVIPAQEYIDEL